MEGETEMECDMRRRQMEGREGGGMTNSGHPPPPSKGYNTRKLMIVRDIETERDKERDSVCICACICARMRVLLFCK